MERTTVNRRYRIDQRIGDGGMAEVYLGQDILLNRPVAIKVLRAQYARDPKIRARFEREAQAVANFAHPHIVNVYDVGEENGHPYIVMEYVQGETLKQIIDNEGPFDPDDVAALVEQVALALDYAHERGVVHRDIKPHNILVDANGLAKVVDFGIAKGLDDANLTDTGTGIGTVHYLSPEQANGLMATPASDVYSLGVVAFEMLTGSLPFDADSPVAVALAHVRDQPPHPSSIEPTIPPSVDAIILRALQKNPTKRFRTAGDFAHALANWRTYDPTSQTPSGRRGSGSHPRVAQPADPTIAWPVKASYGAAPADAPMDGERNRGYAPARFDDGAGTPAAVLSGEGRRNDVGCSTWLIGAIVIALIVGLIVVGAQFSDGFGGLRGGAEDPTSTSNATLVEPASETPTATTEAPAPPVSELPAPNVIRADVESAQATLAEVGLTLQVTDQTVFSETVPEGQIAEQDPPSGQPIQPGQTVFVKLSRGPAEINLIELGIVGMEASAAESTLAGLGLTVVVEDVANPNVPAGIVAGTEPSDVVSAGETVTLQVSQGDAVQIPPAAFGQPVENVAADVEAAGFAVVDQVGVSRSRIESFGVDLAARGVEPGDVVGVQSQDGTATFGAWLPRGTELTLVYYDEALDG